MPRSLSTDWVRRHRTLCVIEMRGIRAELDRLDIAVYAAVANTRTPKLDRRSAGFRRHDFSKLWLGSAAAPLALAGGPQGRRAAVNGAASLGLTSAVVNLVLKPVFGRRRPERVAYRLPVAPGSGCPGRARFARPAIRRPRLRSPRASRRVAAAGYRSDASPRSSHTPASTPACTIRGRSSGRQRGWR